jgi:hypothetical protein
MLVPVRELNRERESPMEVMELMYSYCKDTTLDQIRAYIGLADWWVCLHPGGGDANNMMEYFDGVQNKRALRNRSLGVAEGLTGDTRTDPLVID